MSEETYKKMKSHAISYIVGCFFTFLSNLFIKWFKNEIVSYIIVIGGIIAFMIFASNLFLKKKNKDLIDSNKNLSTEIKSLKNEIDTLKNEMVKYEVIEEIPDPE